MKMLFWGLVIVLVDFRLNGGPDVVPDPLGWLLCLAALREARVRTRSAWFSLAMAGAALGGLVSFDEYVSPPSGELVAMLTTIASTAVVWGTCSGIIASHPDPGSRSTANTIRWLDLGLTIAPAVLIAASEGSGFGIGVPELLLLVIPGLVVIIWFVVFVNRIRPDDLMPAAGVSV